MREIKWYFYSGIMLAWGVAFVQVSVNKLIESPLYAFGIFLGGLFIGLGLLMFPNLDDIHKLRIR